jgi:hypothetical protein
VTTGLEQIFVLYRFVLYPAQFQDTPNLTPTTPIKIKPTLDCSQTRFITISETNFVSTITEVWSNSLRHQRLSPENVKIPIHVFCSRTQNTDPVKTSDILSIARLLKTNTISRDNEPAESLVKAEIEHFMQFPSDVAVEPEQLCKWWGLKKQVEKMPSLSHTALALLANKTSSGLECDLGE